MLQVFFDGGGIVYRRRKESSLNPQFDMDMIDVEGDSVMSPQFHDEARVKKTVVAAGALTAVET